MSWLAGVPREVPDAGAGPLHHATGRGRAAGPAPGPPTRAGWQVRGDVPDVFYLLKLSTAVNIAILQRRKKDRPLKKTH